MGAYAGFDQGLPPELAAAMGQSQQGPPLEEQAPLGVKEIMDAVRLLAEQDGYTPEERLTVEKINTLLQTLEANRFKQDQALVGGGPATQALSRAYGG